MVIADSLHFLMPAASTGTRARLASGHVSESALSTTKTIPHPADRGHPTDLHEIFAQFSPGVHADAEDGNVFVGAHADSDTVP